MTQASPDVVVAGGGLAGLMAAIRAKAAGRSVLLVQRAAGATTVSSGAIDVADEFVDGTPGPALSPFDRGVSFLEAARRVAARSPRHPYTRLAAELQRLPETLAFLQGAAAELGLVVRPDGKNHIVVTELGTFKRTAVVQKSQHFDVDESPPDAVVGVVEWVDLGGFDARPVAEMMEWTASLGHRKLKVVPVRVPRRLSGTAFFQSAADMGVAVEREPAVWATCLKSAVEALAARPAVLLTPAMWSRDAIPATSMIEEIVGCPVRELLALPPSPPGERLIAMLTAHAQKAGCDVVQGSVADAAFKDRRVVGVDVVTQAERRRVSPLALVLATGRFFAGGISRDQVARETVLDLPVVSGGLEVKDRFIGDLTGEYVNSPHAIFRAGVAVNNGLLPVDARGTPLLENVVCAGSVVEGYDPARDGTAAGVALLSGMIAGERAAAIASA